VSSFLAAKDVKTHGDFRGFAHVIDATWKPDSERETRRGPIPAPTRTPKSDYRGHFKIVDQLIWTDLQARGGPGQAYDMYWRLAKPHPWGVYVS
jgi:hypothetical protein